jgi:transposase-like protein
VLVAWGFLEDGRRELLGVSLGNQESYNAWKGFLEDMIKRGLNEPLLTVIDGCHGLIRAVKEAFPAPSLFPKQERDSKGQGVTNFLNFL